MSEDYDVDVCLETLARGSKSFYAASWLLPPATRGDAASVYAFCRIADDAVDEGVDPITELLQLNKRLVDVYEGRPQAHPIDRALSQVVASRRIPREVFEYLLEGFAWDAEGREYRTFNELLEYCVRVACTVGVMMTLIMNRRQEHVLARACDLGVAMQLTNIARDVGEDARAGRVYLPTDWLVQASVDREKFLANPKASSSLARVVERVLSKADRYYRSAQAGIDMLPEPGRYAVAAAAMIYADIGRMIRENHFDSITRRAYTSRTRKAYWVATALRSAITRQPSNVASADNRYAPVLDQAQGLVESVIRACRPDDAIL